LKIIVLTIKRSVVTPSAAHRSYHCPGIGDQAVADANQVLFFNADEGYQISHPMAGGAASLSPALSEHVLRELAPASLLNGREAIGLRRQHQRIDPRVQALVAVLRHSLDNGSTEPLEAESLVLTLVCRSLGTRTLPF
jgi:AraC family transcriptional regulator